MVSGLFDLPWWGLVVVTLVLTHVTIAAVTIFLHRHQAHRALELAAPIAHFFRCWLWLTTGMVTKEWVAIHRKHHARVETADDPHSPQIYGINRVLWRGVFLYVKESHKPGTIEQFGQGTPDDWLEHHIYTPGQKIGIFVMLALDVVLFGVVPGVLVWGVQMAWIPFWAAGVINGVGHWWGYRSFATSDASRNIVPWGILIGGEELHNNHHAYASSARLSNKWYEFDIGWFYIRLMEMIGLARVKRVTPRLRFVAARPVLDQDNLQAILTHRYDVLARYLKSARRVAATELARLQLDARESRWVRRFLGYRADALPTEARPRFEAVLRRSPQLSLLVSLRSELEGLWLGSPGNREQLLGQLQQWAGRAEASGIRQLQEFSLRLRRYAL